MVRQTAAVITLELIGGILLLAVAAVVLLAFLLAQGPVELKLFKADVERALEEARDGRDVSLDRLTLQWSPSDRRMIVAAENLRLSDDNGDLAGQAEQAVITLDAGSLVFGKTEILATELRNGWVEVRQVTPTLWTFAGEPLPEFEARELPETASEWLAMANRILGQLLAGIERGQQSATLESAGFQNVDLRFRTSASDVVGEMSSATGLFSRSADGLDVKLSGSGGGLGLPVDIDASLSVPSSYQGLSMRLGIGEWGLADLATRLGVNNDRIQGFPADIEFEFEFERGAGIVGVAFRADAEKGTVTVGGDAFEADALRLDTTYDPVSDALQINDLAILSPRLNGEWSGSVQNIVTNAQDIGFSLNSDAPELDLTPYFPQTWQLEDASFEGSLDPAAGTMSVSAFSFNVSNGAALTGSIDLSPADGGGDGLLPVDIAINGEMKGDLSVEDLLMYWPETLGRGARNFAAQRVQAGKATAASFTLTLDSESFQQGQLRDDDLDVRFFVEGATVKFMDSLPPVTQGVGTGRLTGNGFSVQLTGGEYGGWEISEGTVQFPQLNPKGELFRVFARGSGPAVNAMENLAEAGLLGEGDDMFDPQRVYGNAEATFEMFRPALDNVPLKDIDIRVSGRITDAGLRDALPDLDLVNGTVDIDLAENLLVMNGFGDLGPAPVQFTWRDKLDDDGAPADLSASAFVSPDFLNRFGIIGRAFVTGDIPVEVQASVSTAQVNTIEVGFDLRQSRVDVSELGWIKPSGEAAKATLSYDAGADTSASTFQFQSDNARFDGDIVLSEEGQLQNLLVREAYLRDFADVGGEITRTDQGTFESKLKGDFLDVSTFFGNFGASGGSASTGLGIPLLLEAELKTLRLRSGLNLENATLNFSGAREGVKEVRAIGQLGNGEGSMSAVFQGATASESAKITVNSDDAGFFMQGMLGQNFLSGGQLDLTGELGRANEPAKLQLSLQNVRMQDAPLLTQVLSLASLRGLADTLSGEGVLFTNIEVPVVIVGDRYIVEGARANGPALGLTLNGWFEQNSDELRLSGVLVPSFGVNSMLGGVPVIGDLFVGRDGEGIFSLTYTVRGTLERAQVAINPLSAVTPGILRRIFENPADTTIPDSLPVDPGLTPPAPPMPDAEFIPSAPGSN